MAQGTTVCLPGTRLNATLAPANADALAGGAVDAAVVDGHLVMSKLQGALVPTLALRRPAEKRGTTGPYGVMATSAR